MYSICVDHHVMIHMYILKRWNQRNYNFDDESKITSELKIVIQILFLILLSDLWNKLVLSDQC